MSFELVMPSSHLILCHPLLLPSVFPSIRVFSSESALCIRRPTYWSFSFSISPSSEYSGPISFRMDWLDLLAVQGTLRSLLQHHSSEASILWHSAFFMVQLSRPYMTTGKTIALTRQTFVGKVVSLHLNMLSRFIITFQMVAFLNAISRLDSSGAKFSSSFIHLKNVYHICASNYCQRRFFLMKAFRKFYLPRVHGSHQIQNTTDI